MFFGNSILRSEYSLKILTISFLILISVSIASAQQVELTSYSLTGIDTKISISQIPDSVNTLKLKLISDNAEINLYLTNKNGSAEKQLVFTDWGNYKVLNANGDNIDSIRVLPGWVSILPPLIAILMALILREVILSLLAGLYVGALFMFNFNPLTAFLRVIDQILLGALLDKDHLIVILFTVLIGAVIGIIAKNGGTVGISNIVVKYAKTAKSGLLSSWLMGLVIFFDDYANTLIIGNMMRPITDKLKISREKLAYIVDSTAAPVASLVIISSWIGFEIGLIDAGLKAINSPESPYDVFIQTIPYRFYPIGAIFLVFLTSYLGRDFGPMFRAEKRARLTGNLSHSDSPISDIEDLSDKYKVKNAKWLNGFIPIMVLILGTVLGLYFTGTSSLAEQGIQDYSMRDIIIHSNSFSALLWASFSAVLIAILMTISQKLLNVSKTIEAMSDGMKSMLFACVILVFAWSIGAVTTELKTADYLISILSDSINPRFLPVLVFIISALISFSTGTSWGTMAIVMPIVIPMASKICGVSHFDYNSTLLIIHGVVSSVLAGSVFGDHCSPIADTTVLSSLASRCNHIDHVKTQLPYAILVGVLGMLLGDIPTAYGLSPYISILMIAGASFLIVFYFGKKVPEPVN